MTAHPAHQIAQMTANAAGELRGYLNPAGPFPWELTDGDHLALLPRLSTAIGDLAACIDAIAQMTADQDAGRQLAGAAHPLLAGCAQIRDAEAILRAGQPGPEPGTGTRPAQLAATGFPEPMTGHLLQAAGTALAPPAAPAARAAARASRRADSQAAPAREPPGALTPGKTSNRAWKKYPRPFRSSF
jgi:hypothetical protein